MPHPLQQHAPRACGWVMVSKATLTKPSTSVSGDTAAERCDASARRYAALVLTRPVPIDGSSPMLRLPAATWSAVDSTG